MIITGATGFLGGQLVRQLRKEYRIVALGRRDPVDAGAPVGAGIEWFRVDIADFERLRQVFERIRDLGGARLLLHMAAHYDFTGDDDPEYHRTNVLGTENLIKLSAPLKLRRFIFASSVAACPFPESGGVVTEKTPPTAPVPYARSKKAGEDLMERYRDAVPSCIVRSAAVFSEWCEYEPLNAFLRTWCSRRWNARVLGGHGISAIPYLHVRDLLSFFLRVVERCDELQPAEVQPHRSLPRRDTLLVRLRPQTAEHVAPPCRGGNTVPRVTGALHRYDAVRAVVDGRVHRPPAHHRRSPHSPPYRLGSKPRPRRPRLAG
jgi:nucleoside-diphosphate-sugar epimerase